MKNLILVAMVLSSLIVAANFSSAQTWMQTSGIGAFQPWACVCSSADGTKMTGALTNAVTFISTNSGASWNIAPSSPQSQFWLVSIACSANGTNLIFASGRSVLGSIYTSTNFGTTWMTNVVPHKNWTSVASSADGNVLVAAATNCIYLSTNMGNVWTLTSAPTNEYWISVSCSGDGNLLAAVATNGPVCVSTDAGNTWSTNSTFNLTSNLISKSGTGLKSNVGSSSSTTNWQAVACSADKTKVVAVVYGGPIYISTDSGMTWTASTNAPHTNWQAVASSADGTRLAAAINGGPIYTSADSGATWISNNVLNTNWVSITSSADGCTLAAAYNNSFARGWSLYYLKIVPKPQLNLAASSSNVAFAWIKPSTNFVLQQSSDLASWSSVTNAPFLNLSNLQYQVTLSPTNSTGFFRLISQ